MCRAWDHFLTSITKVLLFAHLCMASNPTPSPTVRTIRLESPVDSVYSYDLPLSIEWTSQGIFVINENQIESHIFNVTLCLFQVARLAATPLI